jgi:hypothetical protein
MPLPPGASARDRCIDLADQARAKRQDALAGGSHHMAGLWDGHEHTLLRNAYEDVPFPDDANDNEAPEARFDTDNENPEGYVQPASVDDDPKALLTAANT